MTEKPRKRSRKWDVPAENVDNESSGSSASDAAQKARIRAAELAAKLAAEGKLATSAPPPIIAPSAILRPNATINVTASASQISNTNLPDPEIVKLENGGYMAEFEINDLPARLNLTKKAVQDKISLQSGAAIVTKGRYVPPEGKDLLKGQGERPLYLNIQAPIQAKVQVALHMIRDAIKNFGKPEQPGSQNGNQSLNYVQDKVFVGLDFAPPEYNIKEKLEGPNGSYLQHIIAQTGAKVHLRGKGSEFIEQNSGRESFEALHIYLSHANQDGLQAAKSLCDNLLQSVHQDFKIWDQTKRSQPPFQPPAYNLQQQFKQPPTMYPGYNLPPSSMAPPHMAPTAYPPQRPPTGYQQTNYPPPSSYQNQPPPIYQQGYEAPYSQAPPSQHPLPAYLTSSVYPSPASDSQKSSRYAPPQDLQLAQYKSMSDSEKLPVESPNQPSQVRRKRRRFTEDPELIRKSSDQISTKENTSHSLDSNTNFRSTGESARGTSRDQIRLDSPSRDDGENASQFSPLRNIATSKRGTEYFKPPSVMPITTKKSSKRKTSKPKNALTSLIAYDDSESDDEN